MTDDRIRDLLDARLPPAEAERAFAALPPAERREARALYALSRAAATPRPPLPEGFSERTLTRVRARRPPRPSFTAWLLGPRLSPLTALSGAAVAAFLALAVVRYPEPGPAPAGAAATAARAEAARTIHARLALAAPAARVVRVAGDFNGWRPEATPLVRGTDGLWHAEVPVAPGRRYQYMFVVDGEWVTDPAAPATADDGFGGRNAILDV